MIVLLRFSGELSIKRKKVKNRFINKLIYNIKCALKNQLQVTEYQLVNLYDRLILQTTKDFSCEVLSKIFGISSYSIIEHMCSPVLQDMCEIALNCYAHKLHDKSFAIRAKRYNISEFSSHDVEVKLGDILRPYAKKVDLTNPDITIHLEIRPQGAWFYTNKIIGAHGLPLGSQGKALCLLSGGFDSAVAAWFMMKRGVNVDFIFFNLALDDYQRQVVAVAEHLITNWAYGDIPKIYILDFSRIISNIKNNIPVKYAQVVLKRAMYRIANMVAKQNFYPVIITGESLGQVSSQTLNNLCAIEDILDIPVFRPLIGLDKEEIISISKKIGMYSLCEQIKEYCNITSKNVVTNAVTARVDEVESRLDLSVFENILDNLKVIYLRKIPKSILVKNEQTFTNYINPSDVVIDCRNKNLYQFWHYPGSINIEFDLLLQNYTKFDKSKRYVIYCDYTLQSAVVAQRMQNDGYLAYSFDGGISKLRKLST